MKEDSNKQRDRQRGESGSGHLRWVLRIFLLSVALSAVLSFASGVALENAGYLLAVLVLTFFVALGIVFDVIGVAVTAADPKPFHSMASHRAKGAKEALLLLRSAERVASFCNDVVGDICGIVSGATAAVIVSRLHTSFDTESILISIAVTALISGLTIGGKAVGKRYAMLRSKEVVYFAGRVLHLLRFGKK